MATTSKEERIAAVENDLAELKRQVANANSEDSTPWWERHFGVFKDDPYFDEMMKRVEEFRQSQPMASDQNESDVSS